MTLFLMKHVFDLLTIVHRGVRRFSVELLYFVDIEADSIVYPDFVLIASQSFGFQKELLPFSYETTWQLRSVQSLRQQML